MAQNLGAVGAPSVTWPAYPRPSIERQHASGPEQPQLLLGFRPDIDTATIISTAADLFLRLAGAYADHRGVHLETLMGSMAALAGEFALRAGVAAHGHEMPKDAKFVIGGLADPYLYGAGLGTSGGGAFALLAAAAIEVGGVASRLPVPLDIVAKATIAIGGGLPYPPKPSVPEANHPQECSPNACARHRRLVLQIAASHGVFDAEEITLALVYAMVTLFERGKEAFSEERVGVTANDLLTLATEIMIYSARMVPLEAELH